MSAAQTTRSFAEWQAQAQRMRAIARQSQTSRLARLNQLCRQAGLGSYNGCVLHNCFIGNPWREVDYSIARQARRLERQLFEASHIADRWHARTFPETIR